MGKDSKASKAVVLKGEEPSQMRAPLVGLKRIMMCIEGKKGYLFGPRVDPITGKSEAMHDGVDLPVATNSPIYAPWDGVVEKIFADPRGGLSLIIHHEVEGTKTGYAHLRGILHHLDEGDDVKRGQAVALSGETGKCTGPHLHFTVRRQAAITGDWVKVDPWPYLERAEESQEEEGEA